jgi:hypothetical protein
MPIRTACPACGAPYNLADHLEGKTVKCKGCQEPFVVKPLTTKKAKAAGVAPVPSKKKAPAPEDDDIDRESDYEEDDRPARQPTKKPKRKGKKRAKSGAALWIFLAVGGGVLLLLLIGGGVGLMYLLKGGGQSPTAPGNNQTPGFLGGLIPQAPASIVPASVTEEAFDKLRTGMTEEEAIAVVGLPTQRKVGPDDPSKDPVITGPNVKYLGDLVRLIWVSGKNRIELTFDINNKASSGRAKFDDGQGGIRELLGNKYDQVAGGGEQVVWHWLPNGQGDPPKPPPMLPPGPSRITALQAVNAGAGKTADQILQAIGEQPTKRLGPELMPDGNQSADTWIWVNGNGYHKVFFDASGKAIRVKSRNLR